MIKFADINTITKQLCQPLLLLGLLAVFSPSASIAADSLPPVSATAATSKLPTAQLKYKPLTETSRFILEFSETPQYKITQSDGQTQLNFAQPYRIESTTLQDYPRASDISFKQKDNLFTLSFPEPLQQSFEQNNRIVLDLGKPTSLAKPEAEDNLSAGAETSNAVYQNETLGANTVTPIASQIRSLGFSWNIPTNIAVFRRNQYLWIVFDHPQKLNISDLKKSATPLASDIIQIPNPQATVVRMQPEANVNVGLRQEGLLWIIDLYTGTPKAETKDLPVFTQYDGNNHSYMFIPSTSAGTIVSIFDPEVGDVISIIPTGDINVGFQNSYQYPDVSLLKTISGMAILFNADDITLNRGNTGITLRRDKRSLNISDDIEALKRQSLLNQKLSTDRLLFTSLPAETLRLNFTEAETKLKEDIIKADAANKNKMQLALAEYYLSQGLGTNALVILNQLEKQSTPETSSEHFHLLKGVANFLTRRYNEAIENLSFGQLVSSTEALFWRNLSSSAQNPQAEDNTILNMAPSFVRDYPDEIRRRIALVSILSAIKARDDISIQNNIDTIRASANTADKDALLSYYTAKKLEILGYPLNAIREYRNTADMRSEKYSALARRNIVNLQRRSHTISLDKAIAEYEMLRFAWADKDFKINILNLLSDLYIENKDYYQALSTLQSLKNIAGKKSYNSINRRMVKIFEDIYLDNLDDNLPVIKSLALYQDFEWLAPMSANYNAIVQKLADRLVAVDLLDRALYLLNNQLKNHKLTPREQATIGTRIALIDLFKNNPYQALDILDQTENDSISPAMLAHRRIIRAKALSATGQPEKALALLENDYSKNGILMKSEIFWSNGQWGEAADSIKYLIEKPEAGKPLSKEQIQYVLDWATSLKKAGRETVIVRLRNTFEPFFKDTPYYSAFNVLTRTLDENRIDLQDIDQAINDISAFGNFAKIYAQSLQNSSLSETIKE